jgi:hypothetical protein
MPKEANEMIKEKMTREERLMTAINLGIPDRVPTEPLILQFACRRQGVPYISIGGGGNEAEWPRILTAFHDTFEDLGGYDAQEHSGLGLPASSWRLNRPALSIVPPGKEGIPDHFSVQFQEKESITFEDYDRIIDHGWNNFCEEYFPRALGVSIEQIEASQKKLLKIYLEDAHAWNERGVPVTMGASCFTPETILSMGRTLPKFTMDLHRYREKVRAVVEAMLPDLIENTRNDIKATGIPWVHVGMHRGSASYFNLKMYEEVFFPSFKKLINAFADSGFICLMHMDSDWTRNLHYFKELPKGKCICELDGTSDIFKAKEILKGHMCIMGDVPAPLLALGTPEEVTAYCEKLIEIVGKNGGFILSTGCECPVDAKFENVKAMLQTPKNHGPYA